MSREPGSRTALTDAAERDVSRVVDDEGEATAAADATERDLAPTADGEGEADATAPTLPAARDEPGSAGHAAV